MDLPTDRKKIGGEDAGVGSENISQMSRGSTTQLLLPTRTAIKEEKNVQE